MNCKFAVLGTVALLAAASAFSAQPAYVRTCLDVDASLHWKTVTSATMPVALDWPANAVKAVVTGGSTPVTVTDTALRTANVPFALPTAESGEKIVTVAVTYYGAGNVELGTASAKLALVVGIRADEAVSVRNEAEPTAWNRTKLDKPVLPIPAGTTALTINGAAVTPDIPPRGWHAQMLSGQAALALTVGETTYAVTVVGPSGLCTIFR